ncbi:MAG: chemotaxis protein CheW [Betaproteobacteria bacterium]
MDNCTQIIFKSANAFDARYALRWVINLRGAVVRVMDLSARFGKPSAQITKRTCIVIVEIEANDGHQDIGVIVDAVNEVLDIPASEIEPAPAFGAKIRSDFISGMGKVDGKFVIALNLDHVLSTSELNSLAELDGEALAQDAGAR